MVDERQYMDVGKLLSPTSWCLRKFPCTFSEVQLSLELNHPWSNIASIVAAQNAGWRLLQTCDLTEKRTGESRIWKAKVRVVEKIEELKPDPQRSFVPARKFCALHNRKIGIEITRSTKSISTLRETHDSAVAGTCRGWQRSNIEVSYAAGLNEASAGVRSGAISQQLRRLARMGRKRNRGTLTTRRS